MAIRRVRSSLGDCFAIPLEPKFEQYTDDGRGEYVPDKGELFILAQFVFGETSDTPLHKSAGRDRTIMCFGAPQPFSTLSSMPARDAIVNSFPVMEFKVISEAMNRSWWIKLGSAEVSRFLPHQSYSFKSERVTDYHARVESAKLEGMDFRHISQSVNSSMAEALCAHIFGVRDAGFPDFDYNDYLVTEERAVWNVFPERYKLDFSRGLLFDGVSASQSYQGGE